MNMTLWIIAAVLALAFLASGAMKLISPRRQLIDRGFTWAEDFSSSQIWLIGIAEAVGAIGLVVPAAVGVATMLTPLAAAALATLMGGAAITHLRRGEMTSLPAPLVLAGLAATLAVLRFGPYSL